MIASQTRMLWLAKVNEASCAGCHQINADQPILQGFALRRAARMRRSQQGANPKGLSDVGTSENWGKWWVGWWVGRMVAMPAAKFRWRQNISSKIRSKMLMWLEASLEPEISSRMLLGVVLATSILRADFPKCRRMLNDCICMKLNLGEMLYTVKNRVHDNARRLRNRSSGADLSRGLSRMTVPGHLD